MDNNNKNTKKKHITGLVKSCYILAFQIGDTMQLNERSERKKF